MIRCPALHDPANHHTQCFLDPDHDGPHRRYAEPEKPAIEWDRPRVITLTEWIRERISL
mgnify:FL=1